MTCSTYYCPYDKLLDSWNSVYVCVFVHVRMYAHACMHVCMYDKCQHHHGCPFENFQTLYTAFWYAALPYCHYHTLPSSGSGFQWAKYVSPIETTSSYTPICRTKFPQSLPLHINLSCDSIWLSKSHSVCCIFPLLQVIPPINRYFKA